MTRYLKQLRTPSALVVVIAAALIALLSPFLKDAFIGDILVNTLMWSGVALAWNLTAGFAGRLSLGHAAFFGIGAYSSSLVYMRLGWSPWAGAVVGAGVAAGLAATIEAATVRLAGIYYSLATFAFAELLGILARGWRDLTRGTTGLTLPFHPDLANMTFTGKQGYVWLALGYAMICLTVTVVVSASRFGYFLRAQRDEPQAAAALGVDAIRIRLWAGVLSAALTALGGTVFAQYLLYVDPDVAFTWDISVQASLMAIIGGIGTIAGPVWGAAMLVPLGRWLLSTFGGQAGGLHLLIYGPILILAVLLLPRGIVPSLDRVLRRREVKP